MRTHAVVLEACSTACCSTSISNMVLHLHHGPARQAHAGPSGRAAAAAAALARPMGMRPGLAGRHWGRAGDVAAGAGKTGSGKTTGSRSKAVGSRSKTVGSRKMLRRLWEKEAPKNKPPSNPVRRMHAHARTRNAHAHARSCSAGCTMGPAHAMRVPCTHAHPRMHAHAAVQPAVRRAPAARRLRNDRRHRGLEVRAALACLLCCGHQWATKLLLVAQLVPGAAATHARSERISFMAPDGGISSDWLWLTGAA